jgi:hypothetical protein
MPHLFVNRPRLHDVVSQAPSLHDQFRWETINAVLYEFGGLIFVAGSIFFFPSMESYADLGAWLFIVGSLVYLVVTGHDLIEVRRHARNRRGRPSIWERLEAVAAIAYVVGTVLFTIGSVFFLSAVGFYVGGAWCFVIGSLLFVLGATINVLQIVQADDMLTLQLMNLTALTFVIGSILFTVASIPYLWYIETPYDRETINAFLAWQYVVGSGLFLLGGVFNYWRAWNVVRHASVVMSQPRP